MNLNNLSFQIISIAGDVFSDSIMSMEASFNQKFVEAENLINDSKQKLIEVHKLHTDLLFKFANGEEIEPNILFVHALDHFTKAEIFLKLAEAFLIRDKQKFLK